MDTLAPILHKISYMALPLLFAMVLITLFGPRLSTVTIAIGVVAWTAMARLTRAEFQVGRAHV